MGTRPTQKFDASLCLLVPRRVRRVLCPVLLALVSFGTHAEWGTGEYEEERGRYEARVASLERRFNALSSQSNQKKNELDILLDGYSPAERTELVQQYESSHGYFTAYEPFYRLNQKATAAGDLYRDARSVITPEQEKLPELRDNLWTKHIDWLEKRLAAKEAQVNYLGARYAHIDLLANSGVFGFNLAEFMEDSFDDFIYIAEEHVLHVYGEFEKCVVDLGKNMLLAGAKAQTYDVGSVAKNLGSTVTDLGSKATACAEGMALSGIIKAYESAAKKQFLDQMRSQGIHEIVAEYWWDTVALPPKEESFVDKTTSSVLNSVLSAPLDPLKQSLQRTVDSRLKKELEGLIVQTQVEVAQEMLESGGGERWNNAPALDAAKKSQMQARMKNKIEKKVDIDTKKAAKQTVDDVVKAFDFAIDYGAHVALIYMNSRDFSQIERDQVAKYRKIQECLRTAGKNDQDPYEILGVLKGGVTRYTSFLRQCREQQLGDDEAALADADLQPLLDEIQALADRASAQTTTARQACSTISRSLAEVREALLAGELALAEAEQASNPSEPAVDGAALLREARQAAAAAGDAVLDLGPMRGNALELRNRACARLNSTSLNASDVDAVKRAAAELNDLRGKATRSQVRISREVERARRAAARAESATASGSGAGDDTNMESARQQIVLAKASLNETTNAQAKAREAKTTLASIANQAASILLQARDKVGSSGNVRATAGTDDPLSEIERFHGVIISARDNAACDEQNPARIRQMAARVDSLSTRLAALPARPTGTPAAPSGAWRNELEVAVRDAEATEATAELFVEAIVEWAALSAECSEAAARVAARAGGSGWAAGKVTTEAAAGRSERDIPGGSQPNAIIAAAVNAAGRCNYIEAAKHKQQLQQVAPGHPWLAANGDKIESLAARQKSTRRDMTDAERALQAGDLDLASRYADSAARNALSCQSQQVSRVSSAISDAVERENMIAQRERNESNRQAAAGLLQGLLNTMKTITSQTQSGPDGDTASGSDGPPRPTFVGGGGNSGTCANKIVYSGLEPTCKCDGYRWKPGLNRCVKDPNAPVAGTRVSNGGGSPPPQGPKCGDIFCSPGQQCKTECVPGTEWETPHAAGCREFQKVCR